jgi:outer membrane cobalamin receptor
VFLFQWYAYFFYLFVFALAPLSAQEAATKELPKETIQETKDPLLQNPEKVKLISKEEIDKSTRYLIQVLKRINGFRINESGGIGQYANAFIRGGSSQHIKIYLDGIPLSENRFGVADLSKISLSSIESIEIYKGFSPAYLGSANMGAAINLISNKNDLKPSFEGNTRFTYGSFESFLFDTNLKENNLKYKEELSIGFIKAKNNYRFKNDRGTPFNSSDDQIDDKSNNGYQEINIQNKLTKKLENHNLTFLFSGKSGYQELGGPQNAIITDAKNDFHELNLTTILKKNQYEKFKWETSIFTNFQEIILSDPLGEIGFSKDHTKNTLYCLGNKSYFQWTISDIFYGNFLVEPISEWNKKSDKITQQNSYWTRSSLTAIIEPGVKFLQEKIDIKSSLTFLYTHDNASVFNLPEDNTANSIVNYQLAAKFISDSDYMVQVSMGKVSRNPSLFELFGDIGLVTGNQNLKEESTLFGEFSWTKQIKADQLSLTTDFSLTGFIKKNKDLINYQQIGAGITRPFNIENALITGIEVECNLTQKYWDLLLQYTFTDATNKSENSFKNNKQVPGIPQNAFASELTIKLNKFKIFYRFNYVSKEYFDEINLIFEENRIIQDIGLGYSSNKFDLTIEVKNLANKQYEDFANYPLPGRSFWLKVNIPF